MRAKSAMGLATPDLAQREVHMRFLRQSLVGVFLLAITLALLVGAASMVRDACAMRLPLVHVPSHLTHSVCAAAYMTDHSANGL